jgi:hypothetical protein
MGILVDVNRDEPDEDSATATAASAALPAPVCEKCGAPAVLVGNLGAFACSACATIRRTRARCNASTIFRPAPDERAPELRRAVAIVEHEPVPLLAGAWSQ